MAKVDPDHFSCLECENSFIYLEVLDMHIDTLHPQTLDTIEHTQMKGGGKKPILSTKSTKQVL